MAGDRSNYRQIYPAILDFSKEEATRIANNIHPTPDKIRWAIENDEDIDEIIQSEKNYYLNLAEDSAKAKYIPVIKWAIEPLSTFVVENSNRIDQRIKKPLGNPFKYVRGYIDLKSLDLDNDLLEIELDLMPKGDENEILEEAHDLIDRGHGWFGIGKWNISSLLYMEALSKAIAINEKFLVEAIVRFLIDTYIASGDYQSAINIMGEFLVFPKLIYPEGEMTQQGLEAIFFGLMLIKEEKEAIKWFIKMTEVYQSEIKPQVEEWNISELLIDVYSFLKDTKKIMEIQQNIIDIKNLLSPFFAVL